MGFLPNDPKSRQYMVLGFKIVGDFGATIAIPVILFVSIAQWVENKYNIGHWLTIVAFVLSALLTAHIINKKAKEYGKEYHELNEKNKNN